MGRLQEQTLPKIGPQLYQLLPDRYKHYDHTPYTPAGESDAIKFCERFMRVFGDTYDRIKRTYGALIEWHDPRKCPVSRLKYLAANNGWELDGSWSEDFKRIVIDNLNLIYSLAGTERAMWSVIYAHCGITVGIWTSNSRKNLLSSTVDRLSAHYEPDSTYITVGLDYRFNIGDLITVTDGHKVAHSIIEKIDDRKIYLKYDLCHPFPQYSFVFVGKESNPNRFCGLTGYNSSVAGLSYSGAQKAGHKGERNLSEAQRQTMNTIYIEWPQEPSAAILAMANVLLDYIKPARSRIEHIYNDYPPFTFISGLSRTNSRDRAGVGEIS